MRKVLPLILLLALVGLPVVAGAKGRPEGHGKPPHDGGDCPQNVAAAIAAACPCAGPSSADGAVLESGWRNHGQYVRCVVHARNALRQMGCGGSELRGEITRCAARSTCGKRNVVRCCLTDANGTQARILSADECAHRGGTAAGAGSSCEPCP